MEVLLGLAIVGLVVALVYDKHLSSKERMDLIRISKAKDLNEVEYIMGSKEEDGDEDEDEDVIPLEDITLEILEKSKKK